MGHRGRFGLEETKKKVKIEKDEKIRWRPKVEKYEKKLWHGAQSEKCNYNRLKNSLYERYIVSTHKMKQ